MSISFPEEPIMYHPHFTNHNHLTVAGRIYHLTPFDSFRFFKPSPSTYGQIAGTVQFRDNILDKEWMDQFKEEDIVSCSFSSPSESYLFQAMIERKTDKFFSFISTGEIKEL